MCFFSISKNCAHTHLCTLHALIIVFAKNHSIYYLVRKMRKQRDKAPSFANAVIVKYCEIFRCWCGYHIHNRRTTHNFFFSERVCNWALCGDRNSCAVLYLTRTIATWLSYAKISLFYEWRNNITQSAKMKEMKQMANHFEWV